MTGEELFNLTRLPGHLYWSELTDVAKCQWTGLALKVYDHVQDSYNDGYNAGYQDSYDEGKAQE